MLGIVIAALVLASPLAAASHAKGHDNACVGRTYSDRTQEGGGSYQHDIYEACLINVDEGGACALYSSEGHYRSGEGGSHSSTSEGGTCVGGAEDLLPAQRPRIEERVLP